MEMMKEMYQNGDEDMKRTIAQSWQKSQDEKMEKKEPLWTLYINGIAEHYFQILHLRWL